MPHKQKADAVAYRERTKERRRETFNAWERKNIERRNAYKRELRASAPKSTWEERARRNAYNRAWRAANREKNRAYHAAWRAKNPQSRERGLDMLRLREYGMTKEQFDAMAAQQGGVCAICRLAPKGVFHVDHCHVAGTVRALLCGKCNRGLGMFGDNPALLTNAAWYLERHRTAHQHSA